MNLNDKKVTTIAEDFFEDKDYPNLVLGKPYFVPLGSQTSHEPVDYWVVPATYHVFGLEEGDFLHIEDSTGNIMYLLTGHGRKYINGKPDPEPEDDGEDWDDL